MRKFTRIRLNWSFFRSLIANVYKAPSIESCKNEKYEFFFLIRRKFCWFFAIISRELGENFSSFWTSFNATLVPDFYNFLKIILSQIKSRYKNYNFFKNFYFSKSRYRKYRARIFAKMKGEIKIFCLTTAKEVKLFNQVLSQ